MERISPDTQATLLLVNRLGQTSEKPLTNSEYNRLAKELHERGLRPADVLTSSIETSSIDPNRIRALTSRGAALALSMERWGQSGIRVVGRSEATYPRSLKEKLRAATTPILFYSGSLDLLQRDAICVVGSRDPTNAGLAFARSMGSACAKQGFNVVSGDARGVDRESMTAALEGGGQAVGVLAEALSAAVLSKRNRAAILEGHLLLVSPYDPDARFTVAQAMDRNRYLYALARAAVVVDSDIKGGTWSGAVENLKHGWVPALVRLGSEMGSGNQKLCDLGLQPLTEENWSATSLRSLVEVAEARAADRKLPTLPFTTDQPALSAAADGDAGALFGLFVERLRHLLLEGPQTEQAIADHFALEALQAKRWLALAEQRYDLERKAGRLGFRGKEQAA